MNFEPGPTRDDGWPVTQGRGGVPPSRQPRWWTANDAQQTASHDAWGYRPDRAAFSHQRRYLNSVRYLSWHLCLKLRPVDYSTVGVWGYQRLQSQPFQVSSLLNLGRSSRMVTRYSTSQNIFSMYFALQTFKRVFTPTTCQIKPPSSSPV